MSEPIAYDVEGAARAVGLSEVSIRREIAAGRLPVRFYGRKVLIPASALRRWFSALPAERPRRGA